MSRPRLPFSCPLPYEKSAPPALLAVILLLAAPSHPPLPSIGFRPTSEPPPRDLGRRNRLEQRPRNQPRRPRRARPSRRHREANGHHLQVTKPFNADNRFGPTETKTGYPSDATRDSLFGQVGEFNGKGTTTPELTRTGLDPARHYVITFFASRMEISDERTTRYITTGAATVSVELDVAANIWSRVKTPPLAPATDGTLVIALAPGAANTTAHRFTYLGALEIEIADN